VLRAAGGGRLVAVARNNDRLAFLRLRAGAGRPTLAAAPGPRAPAR
jgi:hypothetical protein